MHMDTKRLAAVRVRAVKKKRSSYRGGASKDADVRDVMKRGAHIDARPFIPSARGHEWDRHWVCLWCGHTFGARTRECLPERGGK